MSDAQLRREGFIRPAPVAPESADKSQRRQPQAFLSYAWEGDQHEKWVYDLAKRLQENGIRIILDLCDLAPGSDRLQFMERGIADSDFVIVICTPTYAEKANDREGGVGYEAMVITGALAERIESRKFIPVLRIGDWKSSPPIYLRSKFGVDLRNDPYSETQYEKLIRALHCEPIRLPPVGSKPEFADQPRAVATTHKSVQPPNLTEREAKSNQVDWRDTDPGPCIDVIVTNCRDVIEAGRALGLEYPAPVRMRALLDTGAAVTVVSKTFAKYCKLLQTGETEIRALGSVQRCGEHAGAISFPGTDLRPRDPVRIVSAEFVQERHYAILIGRDILQNWKITFDGRSRCVTIVD